jgi:hypothetical protein
MSSPAGFVNIMVGKQIKPMSSPAGFANIMVGRHIKPMSSPAGFVRYMSSSELLVCSDNYIYKMDI